MPRLKYKNGSSWVEGVDIFFPVGTIYMSTMSYSPASLFGGNWVALTDGRFLRPQGVWNSQGGENTHVLTGDEIPEHRHSVLLQGTGGGNGSGLHWTGSGADGSYGWSTYMGAYGKNYAHNNIPEYRTVYCWYRSS